MNRIASVVITTTIAAGSVAAATDKGARADPSDPASATTPVRVDSGLSTPPPQAPPADPAARWREHNERVGAIGGHGGYVKQRPPAGSTEAPKP